MGPVGGATASAYRKEIGCRTRRGLEGLARAGKSAGSRAYGYRSAAESGTGQIEVDQDQARVVRRIFDMFADGHSPRARMGRVCDPRQSGARSRHPEQRDLLRPDRLEPLTVGTFGGRLEQAPADSESAQ